MSQLDTTSFADDLISMVLSGWDALRFSLFAEVLFQMIRGDSGVPATASLRRQLAMPSPIIPSPMKPIFVMVILLLLPVSSELNTLRCYRHGVYEL